jgi:hypothetical protein
MRRLLWDRSEETEAGIQESEAGTFRGKSARSESQRVPLNSLQPPIRDSRGRQAAGQATFAITTPAGIRQRADRWTRLLVGGGDDVLSGGHALGLGRVGQSANRSTDAGGCATEPEARAATRHGAVDRKDRQVAGAGVDAA